jgi:hypothetical protein
LPINGKSELRFSKDTIEKTEMMLLKREKRKSKEDDLFSIYLNYKIK